MWLLPWDTPKQDSNATFWRKSAQFHPMWRSWRSVPKCNGTCWKLIENKTIYFAVSLGFRHKNLMLSYKPKQVCSHVKVSHKAAWRIVNMSKLSFVRAASSLDPAGGHGLSAVLKPPCISGASLLQNGKEGQAQGSCSDSHVEWMFLHLALTGAGTRRQRVLVIWELCQRCSKVERV